MLTSRFSSRSVARGSVAQADATSAADRLPVPMASNTPSSVAATMARAYSGA